jgi:DUF1707 SHOCT-like domain
VIEGDDLLIGDAERTSATSELRQHYDAGRLTLEEFEGRLERVHAARTESDLREAFRQLPAAKLPTLRPRDTRWRSLGLQYLLVNIIPILVWLLSAPTETSGQGGCCSRPRSCSCAGCPVYTAASGVVLSLRPIDHGFRGRERLPARRCASHVAGMRAADSRRL